MIREWFRGAEVPGLEIWWRDSSGALIDLSTAEGFELLIGKAGCTAVLVKTTGIVGAAGSGTEDDGDPNVTVTWATDELDVEPGSYLLTLTATIGGLDRVMSTTAQITDNVDEE